MLFPIAFVNHLENTFNNLQKGKGAFKVIASQKSEKSSSKCGFLIQNTSTLTAVELLHLAVTTDHKATQSNGHFCV